jgi:hypothetical protein
MFGEVERTLTNNPTSEHSSDLRGLVPRAVEYMFKQVPRLQMLLKDVKVECQFLEIYCDKIRDLGQAYNRKNNQLAATAAAGSGGAGGGGGGAAATGRDRTNSASSSRGEEPVTPTRALRTSNTALSWGVRISENFEIGHCQLPLFFSLISTFIPSPITTALYAGNCAVTNPPSQLCSSFSVSLLYPLGIFSSSSSFLFNQLLFFRLFMIACVFLPLCALPCCPSYNRTLRRLLCCRPLLAHLTEK